MEKLTAKQWNMIRVYELPTDLSEVRYISVTKEAIDKLLSDYADQDEQLRGRQNQIRFRRAAGWEQASKIFDLKARSLYPDIQVRSDPPAMATFRRRVHTQYVINYCGTTQCHGGIQGGELFLFRDHPNQDATVYTNFYILNQSSTSDGRMIDRDEPSRSLLLQYGLPRDAAATPHPEVPGWQPQFVRGEDDPNFAIYVDWIHSLWRPAPNYNIDYSPPRPGVTPTEPTDNHTNTEPHTSE